MPRAGKGRVRTSPVLSGCQQPGFHLTSRLQFERVARKNNRLRGVRHGAPRRSAAHRHCEAFVVCYRGQLAEARNGDSSLGARGSSSLVLHPKATCETQLVRGPVTRGDGLLPAPERGRARSKRCLAVPEASDGPATSSPSTLFPFFSPPHR